MHEVSLARTLVQTLEGAAREAGLSRVTRMQVELGERAGTEPEALSFALSIVGHGSLAEGAEVVYTGPGAQLRAPHEHGHEHAHDERVDLDSYGVRLSWIEGT